MKLQTLFLLTLSFSVNSFAKEVEVIETLNPPQTGALSLKEISELPRMGRSIVNQDSNEKIELVCLENKTADQNCSLFQLRYTKDGTPKLIGSEMMVKTSPEPEFQSTAEKNIATLDANTTYRFMPWFKHLDVDQPDFASPLAMTVILCTVLSPVTVADFILSVGKAPFIGISNVFKTMKRNSDEKKIRHSIESLFSRSEVNQEEFRLNSRRFNYLKQSLLENMN